MLTKPEHGWSCIKIGNWNERCSYLDDVPYLLLDAMESACRTWTPHCVKLDAEGWEYIIVFDMYETHIISDNCDKWFVYTSVECDLNKLSLEMIEDIRNNINSWAAWVPNQSDDEVNERKKDLSAFCDVFERRIKRGGTQ